MLASYPFPILIMVRSIEDALSPDCFLNRLPTAVWFVSVRASLVLLTLVAAVLIPHFALMLAFVGSLTSATTCFVLPCLFHLRFKHGELRFYYKILGYCIISFGIAAAGFGIVFSGKALVKAYKKS